MEEFERLRKRIDELYDKALKRLRELRGKVEEISKKSHGELGVEDMAKLLGELYSIKIEVREVVRTFKFSSRGVLREAKEALSRVLTPEDARDYVQDLRDYFEERLDLLVAQVEAISDLTEDLRKRFRQAVGGKASRLREIRIKLPEIAIPDLGRIAEEIEKSLSSGWSRTPSIVVSSIRLPSSDLKVIDALVEAGIFRSRNEGIAFFVHRGIESSREWLERVKSKIEEIKRLREEARRELEELVEKGGDEGRVKIEVE